MKNEPSVAGRLPAYKSFVTNGGFADSYVVSTASAEADASDGHFSCVLVQSELVESSWGEVWRGTGMRGNSARTLTLDDVHVSASDLLGSEGDQIWYVFNVVAPYFLAAMAGTCLGVGARALDEVVGDVKGRSYDHSGGSVGQFGVIQHRLGQLWPTLARTRRLSYWAANEADHGGPEGLPGIMAAKAEVADAAVRIANECQTLAGGRAYRSDSILERLLRDARAAHVMAPTTDILYTWIGRVMIG